MFSEPTLHIMEGPGSEQTEPILQREPLHGSVGSHHQPARAMTLQTTQHLSRNWFNLHRSAGNPDELCFTSPSVWDVINLGKLRISTLDRAVWSLLSRWDAEGLSWGGNDTKKCVLFNFQLVGCAHGLHHVNVWQSLCDESREVGRSQNTELLSGPSLSLHKPKTGWNTGSTVILLDSKCLCWGCCCHNFKRERAPHPVKTFCV